VFAVRFKPYMGQSEGTFTIVEYEAPRRVVFRGRIGKMEPTLTHTVEPNGGEVGSPAGSRWSRTGCCA
jgi:hypothetical protein